MFLHFFSLLLNIEDTVAEWLKALDCKSSDIVIAGSNPARVIS